MTFEDWCETLSTREQNQLPYDYLRNAFEAGQETEREACKKVCDVLHAAICQAVATMNISPEIARNSSLREAHNCLRQVLGDFAEQAILARGNK